MTDVGGGILQEALMRASTFTHRPAHAPVPTKFLVPFWVREGKITQGGKGVGEGHY